MIAALLVGVSLAGLHADECGPDPLIEVFVAYEDMLVGGHPADQLHFANCLEEAGFPGAAHLNYFDVVHAGDLDPEDRMAAIQGAMRLVDQVGDVAGARMYMGSILPGDAPQGEGRDTLFYLIGLNQLEQGKPLVAALWLEEVPAESPWHGPATLARAKALESGGQVGAALELYARIPDDAVEGPDALARRALLLAREQRVDEAIEVLDRLAETGERVGLARGVQARLYLERGDLEAARRSAKTVLRAGRRGAYSPEAELLLAEVHAAACRTRAARRHAERQLERWEPVRIAMDTAVNVGRVDGERIVEVWSGSDPVQWGLPEVVRARILDHPERAGLVAHLALLDKEIGRVHAIDDHRFQALLAPLLEQALVGTTRDLQELLGRRIAGRMHDLGEDIAMGNQRAEEIRAAPPCRSAGMD